MAYTVSFTTDARSQKVITTPNAVYTVLIVDFTATPSLPFERIGYFHLFNKSVVSPFQTRLFYKSPMYRPGIVLALPSGYSASGFPLVMAIDWNRSGLACTVTFQ